MFEAKQYKSLIPYGILLLVVFVSSAILWLPFLLKLNSWFGLSFSSFDYIYKNYDGLFYIVVGKSLYNPTIISHLHLDDVSLSHFPKYFAAHMPLYPLFIRLGAVVIGYLKSMLFTNLLFSALLAMFFYYFIKTLGLSKKPLLLTIVFLMLPRFLLVRSIGAPESLFMLLVLLSLFFFEKKKMLLAGLFGGLATVTKTPGILLFIAYGLVLSESFIKIKKTDFRWLALFLIPLFLLAVFVFQYFQYGDILAYFHSGNNIHLVAPFSVFDFKKTWVGTAWLEDVIFYFFLYLFTVFSLKNVKQRSILYFGLIFFIALTFIQHRDISRYSLPLWPLACIAFEKFFTSRKFIIVFLILLPAIYLYGWNFLLYNVMPVGQWKPFI